VLNHGYKSQSLVALKANAPFSVDSDDVSGIESYDVRISRTPMRSGQRSPWTYPQTLQRTTTVPRIKIRRGQVICVGVRARDTAGNQEAWDSGDNEACIVRAVDDSSPLFERRGQVEVVRSPKHWRGRARVLHRGSRLTMRAIPRHAHVTVVSTTLPDNMRGLMWDFPGVDACFAWNSDACDTGS
jgi:hypothetical protein